LFRAHESAFRIGLHDSPLIERHDSGYGVSIKGRMTSGDTSYANAEIVSTAEQSIRRFALTLEISVRR
jgi:hypothetical protein